MSIILGQSMFTIRGADHLQVDGGLVQIQRSSPTGFETVAVAGEGLLVTIERSGARRSRSGIGMRPLATAKSGTPRATHSIESGQAQRGRGS